MYLALYRKYRPSTFDDVISQEHITTTLKNQISTGQIAHAYLFTGTRGTGKTSCAKIMAKAVNCLSPQEGNPCGHCAACKAIEQGSTDIIEIDAASNNGVDNIRQIRDEVIYTPIDCKYKVYIIDEVHMLSAGAFNALLKTLEEPPSHVIFILATTEYYKVPATILSRCQQLLFSKIDAALSAKRLLEIAEKEGIALEPSAAQLIARLSDGAMRDALSLMDQCISVSDRIDENLVRECSGAADSEYLFALSRAAIDKAPAAALKLLDGLIVQGKDISRFVEELTTHYRNLMLEKTVGEELIKASDSELEQYRRQSRLYSLDEIMYHIDLISDSLDNINRMKQTGQARLLAEQLLIRLTSPRLANDSGSLAARIGSLENRLERLSKEGLPATEERKLSESGKGVTEIGAESTGEIPPKDNYESNSLKSAEESALTEETGNAPPTEYYSYRSETITGFILPAYDDIPLPPPPPEEAFEGNYGYERELGTLNEKAEEKVNKPYSAPPKKSGEETAKKKPSAAKAAAEAIKSDAGRPIPEIELNLPPGTSPLPQWQDIITAMPARSRGLLKSSQAYLYDGKIYISPTVSSEKVLKDGAKAEELRQRVKDILGAAVEMFILKAAPVPENTEIDRVSSFLDKAKALGINVTVK